MNIINFYYELAPKDNIFHSIYVDITHKCNMECANCFIPNRDAEDIDKNKLYEILSQLPKKTEIRLLGGEPTVRKDLVEIVAKIKELGHRPNMQTNGLMLARPGYARELADAGMRSIYISMNGADDDDVYEKMDGLRCAERKIAAWQACTDVKMNVNIGAILQKGTNDHIPLRLLNLSKEIGGNPIFRFRNVGQIGRYTLEKNENWTFDETINLVCDQFGVDPEWAKKWNVISGYQENNIIFFPLDETKRIKTPWVKITNWSPDNGRVPDPGSKRRGRLTPDYKIAPHFEHIILNENIY
jgi:MoaA/NifB/PqqE/SkfB family radical SAM enzyme